MKLKLLSLITTVGLSAAAGANFDKAVNTNNLLNEKLASAIIDTQEKAENFMISGTSLGQALSIVANGSAGHTRAELENYLQASIEDLNVENKSLIKSLNFTAKQKKELQAQNQYASPAVITSNNSIWRTDNVKDGGVYVFSPEFIKTANDFYSASHNVMDFSADGAADKMNKWAEDNTNGLVKKIIDQGTVKEMLWAVMNATYLEAAWGERFYELGSDAPSFIGVDGEVKEATMMKSTQYVNYMALEDNSELVSLRLRSDQANTDLAFVAYLPAEGKSLSESQKDFYSAEVQKTKMAELHSRSNLKNTIVTMPKFSFAYTVELKAGKDITHKLGLNHLFEKYTNLSAMATQNSVRSKVSLIKQSTKIELDEKGIKAAAVTIIGGIRTTSLPPRPTHSILLDRPFMFAIVDRTSKTVLFSGSLVNPAE